eukprot:GGOE01030086.1.p1 GENE.GGOE01030086.1~~GGOE01030086.1.p1  ORF type:complete len:340 (+),score=78.16 GGOE01030086.1:93-1112(+)
MDSSPEASEFGSDVIDISDVESELSPEELAAGDNSDDCSEGDAEPFFSPLGLVFAIVEDEQLGERLSSSEESEHPWWAMLTLKGVADHPEPEYDRDEGALLYFGVLEDELEVECDGPDTGDLCTEASGTVPTAPGPMGPGKHKSRIAAAIEFEAWISSAKRLAPAPAEGEGAPVDCGAHQPSSSSSSSSSSSAALEGPGGHVHRIRGLAFKRVSIPEQLSNADVLGLLGMDTWEQREARLHRDKLVVSRLQAERLRAQDCAKIFHEVMQTLRLGTSPIRERQQPPPPQPSPPALPPSRHRSSSIRRSDGFGATKKGQKVKLAPLPSADEGQKPAAPHEL